MRVSSFALTTVLAIGAPFLISGFTPNTSFTRSLVKSTTASRVGLCSSSHKPGCSCFRCAGGCSCAACQSTKACPPSCRGPCCSPFALRMSEEPEAVAAEVPEAVADEVPADVTAMDGIASEEEAHNVDRPARGSGIAKKTRKEGKGTPVADLEIGSTVTGKVKAVMAYGAFIDIGAATDALLHVSRLSDEFVSDVASIVKVGQEVSVRIVSADAEKGQVGVSMRSEEADAKDSKRRQGGSRGGGRQQGKDTKALLALIEKGYNEDTFVEGEVVNTLDFGAFVRVDTSLLGEGLEGQIEGLVHISSLAEARVDNVESIAKAGDKVQVRVKVIDEEGGKISLSMIPKDKEQQPRKKGGRKAKQRWTAAEMGAADWKESLEKFSEGQPKFNNNFIIVEKRKKTTA